MRQAWQRGQATQVPHQPLARLSRPARRVCCPHSYYQPNGEAGAAVQQETDASARSVSWQDQQVAAPASASTAPGAVAAADQQLIVTTFKWPSALGGHEVAVAGSFNGWGPPLPLGRTPRGDFVRSLALPPAGIDFKFLVDGEWMASPCERVVYSGSGAVNNYRLVQPTATFTWRASSLGGREVMLAGDWSCWAELLPMRLDERVGDYSLQVCLPPGSYQYQFLVDGQWRLCGESPTTQREDDGHFANTVEVRSLPAYHIFYATGWAQPVLHVRALAADGTPQHPGWREIPMHHTPSRAHPKGGSWFTAVISAVNSSCPEEECGAPVASSTAASSSLNGASSNGAGASSSSSSGGILNGSSPSTIDSSSNGVSMSSSNGTTPAAMAAAAAASSSCNPAYQQLEFYVSAGDGSRLEDRPPGGSAYRLCQPGGFKLRSGMVRPFPNATHPPMMLVSDLDGTMVGEGEEADAATAEFGAYWEENAALAGSVLVYNTGRSIGQFLGLLESKAGALPVPDVVISAVGTKIFRLDTEGGTRSTASGMVYHEDLQYSRTLDEGWDLATVRAAAQGVVDALPGATAWLDDGSEHPHRCALSVRVDVLSEVVERLQSACAAGGVSAQVITSGTHDWRYVDVVAARGGKLAALEYVRTLYGIARSRCVAAGDSGNDILMLGGSNPAVVVGNCQQELLDWVLRQPQEQRLVVTDAPLARGILEGLARHGLY